MRFTPRWALGAALLPAAAWCDGILAPLTMRQVETARNAVAAFKADPRGPYFRIRWYCKDGSVHRPDGNPCASRGGGNQHAEPGQPAKQLAEWNIHAGTILTGLAYERLADAARDHHWLKELALQKYLVEVDQGWIYRRASSYRGARQIEDEERAGREVLVKLFADPEWLARNYYLATQLVDALPHGVGDSQAKRIRTLATTAAGLDTRFQTIRAKIHSYPGPEDLKLVKDFLVQKQPAAPARKAIEDLQSLLEARQNPGTWIPRLQAAQKRYADTAIETPLGELILAMREMSPEATLRRAADVSMAIRRDVMASKNGRRNLDLLDLNQAVQERAFLLRQSPPDFERRQMLAVLYDHFRMATGAGLLSMRQLSALEREMGTLAREESVEAGVYRASVKYLARATEWSRATVARDFGPVSRHYEEFEPLAKGLVDHLLRSSSALAMTALAEALMADADRAAGIRHSVFSRTSGGGVVGLNPGVAVGRLGIVNSEEDARKVDARGIYVIPETASDLKPVAGILTLDSGNLLSHAQLLAANLGIPNAVIPSSLKPEFAKRKGLELFFAVTPRLVVILKEKAALTDEEGKLWAAQPAGARARIPLDTSRLRLDDTRMRSLTEVGTHDSGVICGPKAANLGQLASYFPDKVAKGIVIPFGVYRRHVARVLDGSGTTLEQQMVTTITSAEGMKEAHTDFEFVQAHLNPQLARFRKLIQSMPLIGEFERELTARLEKEFGADGTYGVFVRSDTNAEDLPEFTGAGLNLTVPNVAGVRNVIQALKNVWASPLTERAYEWRSRALIGAEKVYPSVIIMRAVPSDKSGVIGTVDLETGDPNYFTVNASEGVSAVVDGGVAESLLVAGEGDPRLLQQCRATYRKAPAAKGGFVNLAPLGGDVLLQPDEIRQLREMVAEVKRKYPPARTANGTRLPWDIEFGFEKGQLRLFQIRPLVRFQEWATLEALSRLEKGFTGPGAVVKLSGKLLR